MPARWQKEAFHPGQSITKLPWWPKDEERRNWSATIAFLPSAVKKMLLYTLNMQSVFDKQTASFTSCFHQWYYTCLPRYAKTAIDTAALHTSLILTENICILLKQWLLVLQAVTADSSLLEVHFNQTGNENVIGQGSIILCFTTILQVCQADFALWQVKWTELQLCSISPY